MQEVVGIGGGGDEAEVVDDGGREGRDLFLYDVYVNFRQTPLTQLSVREHSCLHVLLRNNCQTLLSVLSLYIRQALDPCLRCWSQLAGGTPPGPPGTHASSQFWYTSLIPVFLHIFHLMAQHSLPRVLCLDAGYSLFTHFFHVQVSSGVLLSPESSMLYLDLHLYHSTHFARPCLARGKPLVP